jgi:hypothetical protein
MQTPLQQALVLSIVVFNAYCLGANCVERFVNYQTWHLIPVEAFKAYHRAQQPLIKAFVVAPMVVGFGLQVWLAFRVPAGIDPLVAWVMVIASAAGAVSTVTLQLPIHAAFNRSGYSPEHCSVPIGSERPRMLSGWLQRRFSCISYLAVVRPHPAQLAQ